MDDEVKLPIRVASHSSILVQRAILCTPDIRNQFFLGKTAILLLR